MVKSDPSEKLTPAYEIEKHATPEGVNKGGYYGIPILKRPFWHWEIALYFFFEGVSAGSFLLCSAAEFAGGKRYGGLIRKSRVLLLANPLPFPPLLISDLGRPQRLPHHFPVFQKNSP